ncbi:MAG: bacillithiol biosynthesis cysteine-adding enzyme BshC [Flavobacteriales bacterium]|nr:bacillithiol biosynthesis cysteine-adding enzyme BshC [Flavobacteriales bacterium]
MKTHCVSYNHFPILSPIIKDLVEENDQLKPFIRDFASVESLLHYAENRTFSNEQRVRLYEVLKNQNQHINLLPIQQNHIEQLRNSQTFTICTGHQLCFFTGPAYFIYKIASVINLCQQLKSKAPDKNFVPIFWMASEDHDFEEANHFFLKEQKLVWESEETGKIGSFSTENALKLHQILKNLLGKNLNEQELLKWFQEAYSHSNLSEATRFLVQKIFGSFGILCLDSDDLELKKAIAPFFKKELEEKVSFDAFNKMDLRFPKKYKRQINARVCNLFYLGKSSRERIIPEKNGFSAGEQFWTTEDFINHIQEHPEKLSPNVLLRPVFQEFVLPNLAYIGGGGEINYWLQLKEVFQAFEIPFPILILRKSVLMISDHLWGKMGKNSIEWKDILLTEEAFINHQAKESYTENAEIHSYQEQQKKALDKLRNTFSQWSPQIESIEKKIDKEIARLKNRAFKDFKQQKEVDTRLFNKLNKEIFPNNKLQERQLNFSNFYRIHGQSWVDELVYNCDVLHPNILFIEH